MDRSQELIPHFPVIAPKPDRSDRRVAERRLQRAWLKTLTGVRRGGDRRRPPKDRRATARVSVELPCEAWVGTTRFIGTTTDLSTFGLSTRAGDTRHQVGTRVDLILFLPDGAPTPVELRAEVVGRDEGQVRFAFRRPRVDAIRRIHKYLSACR